MKVSAQTGLNWFLLSLQTAKPSDIFFFFFHYKDFWTKYFFLLLYDDVYRAEGHTAVEICVKQSWKKLYIKILMRETLKNFTEVATLAASGGFLYDLHEYFRFSSQLFNIMKKLCKRGYLWHNFMIFHLRPKRRWNIFWFLKSW